MPWIRTGARQGLRWGVFGFAACATVLTVNSSRAAPYADIVVDANSGKVLHATNPEARRHPASLTKIMTLYLLFERLEAGKLRLDTQLKVSEEAAEQSPTRLGLKAGSTISVEDAIKGLITRSANDAAVVIAEAIAGDEDAFARLMTRKAQALGMSRTVYTNASGLPDDDQITTARDQSVLGRALQERFPQYYKYFSLRSFTFRGKRIGNHNRLLGRVDGVDGIKTGYIRASGFNLVTSVRRGNRHLVAVVMGGSSAGSRDARMRELISDKIASASTKRTAPMIAEAGEPKTERTVAEVGEARSERALAKAETKPATPEAKGDGKVEARLAVASASSMPVRLLPSATRPEPAAAPAAASLPRVTAGSTEPIKPVLVKTLTVKAALAAPAHVPSPLASDPTKVTAALAALTFAGAKLVPLPTAASAGKPQPQPSPRTTTTAAPSTASAGRSEAQAAATAAAAAVAAVKTEPPAAPAPATMEKSPVAAPAPAAKAEPGSTISGAPAPSPAALTRMATRHGWIIQVGAYPAEQTAKQRLNSVQTKASKILGDADPFTETVEKGGTTYYRARFAGLDKDQAEAACKYLKRNDVECVAIRN
jgi:D-alanyl-D-alanine carboxypeptidase